MNNTSLSNFLNNAEAIMSNVISNNEITIVTSDDGSVVLISERDLVNLLKSKEDLFDIVKDRK